MIGNGVLLVGVICYVAGIATFPVGRAAIRGLWNKIASDVGYYVHQHQVAANLATHKDEPKAPPVTGVATVAGPGGGAP